MPVLHGRKRRTGLPDMQHCQYPSLEISESKSSRVYNLLLLSLNTSSAVS